MANIRYYLITPLITLFYEALLKIKHLDKYSNKMSIKFFPQSKMEMRLVQEVNLMYHFWICSPKLNNIYPIPTTNKKETIW